MRQEPRAQLPSMVNFYKAQVFFIKNYKFLSKKIPGLSQGIFLLSGFYQITGGPHCVRQAVVALPVDARHTGGAVIQIDSDQANVFAHRDEKIQYSLDFSIKFCKILGYEK